VVVQGLLDRSDVETCARNRSANRRRPLYLAQLRTTRRDTGQPEGGYAPLLQILRLSNRRWDKVTDFFDGASRGRGQSMDWRLKAPQLQAQAGWRSYPPGGGQALPGSVDWRCFRSFVMEDVPSFRGGEAKLAHAGVPAASPMWLPLEPEPSPQEPPPVPSAANPLRGTASRTTAEDWTKGRRGPARRGPADLGPAHPRRDRCVAPRPVQQTRARQRSQRRPRDAS